MPRQPRLDIAGCMYHVVARGIERRKIFLDEEDCQDFTVRLGSALKKTGCKCLAWCLMPNHFHLLLMRGNRTLSELINERVLGHGEFVEAVLKEVGNVLEEKMSQEEILKIIHDKTGINQDEITGGSQARMVARAKAMYCCFAKESGVTKGTALAKELKLTSSTISRLIERGKVFCKL